MTREIEYYCEHCGTTFFELFGMRFPMVTQCDNCGCKATTTKTLRKPGDEGSPAIQGDVPSAYFSEHLNQVVHSKRDVREAQRRKEEQGYHVLGNRDMKDAVHHAWAAAHEKQREDKWFAREGHKHIEMDCGDAPSETPIAG